MKNSMMSPSSTAGVFWWKGKVARNQGKNAKKIRKVIDDPNNFLSTIQIGITLAGFLSSAFAASTFASYFLVKGFILFGNALITKHILVVLITIILSYFSLVFGELVPKKIALANPIKVASLSVNLIIIMQVIFYPLIKILSFSTNVVCKILGIKERKDDFSEEDIKRIILTGTRDGIIEKKEQVMLLLNRRGFSTLVTCTSCGYTFKCPNCDITLTYHKTNNTLRCHYCGHFEYRPNVCPECKNDLNSLGMGTQKLEEEISKAFPSAKVLRMDADTTSKKGMHEKLIKEFKEKRYDIMLGTQMISKGLNFDGVSLVGVINADNSLNLPDFRSGERTYSMLEQTSGRAGRSGLDSLVIIQTFNKDNYTLKMLESGSFTKNYAYEMGIRKKLKYPPYYYLIGIKVCSKEYELASKEANKIYNYIKPKVDKETIILGPTTAGIFRIKSIYRFQLVIKYRFDKNIRSILSEVNKLYIDNKDVYLEIDIDPYTI